MSHSMTRSFASSLSSMKLIHFSRGLNHVSIDVKTVTNNASIGTQPWIGNFDDSSFILGDHSTLNNDGKFTNDGLFNTTNLSGNIINRVKGTMVNNGLFNQGGLGVFSNQSSSTFTNSGRVNVFVSLLDNRGTIDNSGTIKIFHFGAYQNKGGVLEIRPQAISPTPGLPPTWRTAPSRPLEPSSTTETWSTPASSAFFAAGRLLVRPTGTNLPTPVYPTNFPRPSPQSPSH